MYSYDPLNLKISFSSIIYGIMAKSDHVIPQHEVITGPMFAGKTRELQRQCSVYKSCGFNVQVFRRDIDTRYSKKRIVTHDGVEFCEDEVFLAKNVRDIVRQIKQDTEVIMIDEAQFYDASLLEKIDEWVDSGRIVVTTVLPTDYTGKTFGLAGDLLAGADKITQVFPRCIFQENGVFCHRPATRTYRKGKIKKQVVIGGTEMYEPRCRKHHKIKNK